MSPARSKKVAIAKEVDPKKESLIKWRKYQLPIFRDRETGVLVLHWSRQIGKSFTLAAWAVDRLLTRPGRLVTVLSNSKDNGLEFIQKCAEVCSLLGTVFEQMDESPDVKYENMRMIIRITVKGKTGRIIVLAANPRTARGFSGDLILDEFAFHENSAKIWEAAEPILSSNPDYLCRISSTGNGRHNFFYTFAHGPGANNGDTFESPSGFIVSRTTRTEAWKMGVKIYDLKSKPRREITPDEARRQAQDKRAYDQNYECQFNDENMCLLTHELIQAAERGGIAIDDQDWSAASLQRMEAAQGNLFLGGDVGRNIDRTVFAIMERNGRLTNVIAMLRLDGMRLPDQQKRLDTVCLMPRFRRACIDMTGLGLGLVEYAQEKWGTYKIQGINFATTEPVNDIVRAEGRKAETVRVTENMATDLLNVFEDKSLAIHVELDSQAREDLRKPERITSPGGKVSIAATRTEAGHADHFWAFALGVRAAQTLSTPGNFVASTGRRAAALAQRKDREIYA